MRKLLALLLTLSGGPFLLPAQQTAILHQERLSPSVFRKNTDNQTTTWWLLCKDTSKLRPILRKYMIDTGLQYYPTAGLVSIRAHWGHIRQLLQEKDLIQYIDRPRLPKEELTLQGFDASVNQLSTAARFFPPINGRGLVLSVKEKRPDTADIDFRGRWLSTPLTDAEYSSHASIMATMAAGAGNSHYTGKGAAWGAKISSSSFNSLLPDEAQYYRQYQISVQNHSYGTGIENYYGADALAYDASVVTDPYLLHVFSAGNEGNSTSTSGTYSGIPRFANLTGSFKMAKNIITVGAVNDQYDIMPLSSRGPAYDGRLKPAILAFGQEGSSGAAAIVSGIALQIQQACRDQDANGLLPAASLVKSILINAADDAGNEGPDFIAGYGNANAFKSLLTVSDKRYQSASLQEGAIFSFPVTVDVPASMLKVTICWTDPPGSPTANKALVNDLDLSVVHNGTSYLPWVLSHSPHIDSLQKPARRAIDTINNTEQVSIQSPVAGTYEIRVRGTRINSGSQLFSVAWQVDTANQFKWYYPLDQDALQAGVTQMIRWSSTFESATGVLEYSINNGQWQMISSAVSLSRSCFRWQVPDTDAVYRLRMTVNEQSFESPAFIVGPKLVTHTGFNCTDSFLIAWNKPTGIEQYQVYSLGENDQYLQPLQLTSDSLLVMTKQLHPQRYFAIAPMIAGRPARNSFAFDYTTQGVGCYFKNFLAHLVDPRSAAIDAELGSLHGVRRLALEKATPSGYAQQTLVTSPATLQYQWNDDQLRQGTNTWRIRLDMESGAVIYSNPESVFTALAASYIVYPNPVAAAGVLQVFAADFEPAFIQLYNMQGQMVKQQLLIDHPQQLSMAGLKSGVYFLMVRKNGGWVYKTTVMVK